MTCPKCGSSTTAILYTLRCIDYRAVCPDGTDETLEIVAISTRPKTGTCEKCDKRIPLPDGTWVS